jgi:hypothetical protein
MNHNTLMHTELRVFILTDVRTYLNPRVPCETLLSTSMSTPTLKSSHKPRQTAKQQHGKV